MPTNDTVYINRFLNFYFEIAPEWRFTYDKSYVRDKSSTASIICADQTRQDRVLFGSYIPSLVSGAKCNLGVYIHSNDIDLLCFSEKKDGVVDCRFSKVEFLKKDAQELILRQVFQERELNTKVIFWNVCQGEWASVIGEASSAEYFSVVQSLISNLRPIE